MTQPEIQNATPQKEKKKVFVWVAVAVVLVMAAVAGWFLLKPSDPNAGLVSGNGRIEATEIDVATKLGGRVLDILVNEGDFVKAGQLVAKMQVDALEARRSEALAQLQQAKSAIVQAEAQVAVRKGDVATANAGVGVRKSELDAVQRRYERYKTLNEEQVISVQEFDDVRAEFHGKSAAVTSSQAQVIAAQAAVTAAEAQVANTRSGVLAAEAAIDRIDVEVEDTLLKAPRDGRVQYRIVQPGEVLGAGGKVLSLVDLGDVYMTFFLPETAAGKIALGSDVRIVLDAAPQYVIPAKVSYVASVAQFTPKTVETASERQKLMFRVKARISPELLQKYIKLVKSGLPGIAWLRPDSRIPWPAKLKLKAAE